MVYYRILNADPCVVQSDLVIYPSYINWFASSHPELPVCPSPTHPPLGTSKSALRVCEPASASWVSSLVSCFGCCLCLTKPTVDLGAHSTLHSVAPVHRATHQLSCRLTKKLLSWFPHLFMPVVFVTLFPYFNLLYLPMNYVGKKRELFQWKWNGIFQKDSMNTIH